MVSWSGSAELRGKKQGRDLPVSAVRQLWAGLHGILLCSSESAVTATVCADLTTRVWCRQTPVFNILWSHLTKGTRTLLSTSLFSPIKGRLYWWEAANGFGQPVTVKPIEIELGEGVLLLASVSGVYSQSALWQDTDQLLLLGCNTEAKHALNLWQLRSSVVMILDSWATHFGSNSSAVFSQKTPYPAVFNPES